MFPNLPGFTTPSVTSILNLANADQDPNAPPENLNEPSAFTYLGQFADHDLTLDASDQPTSPEDPTQTPNNETFAFDLSDVFGNPPQDPASHPELYAADGKHLCIADPNVNGVPDLCRNPLDAFGMQTAKIPDGRNDENELISQIQVAFIKFYNRLIDQGQTPEQARTTETHLWQWIVLKQLLPTFIGQDRVDQILNQRGNSDNYRLDTPLFPDNTFTPVEFSVAAYRLHTIVRLAYVINDQGPNGINKVQVFNAAGNDLHGGRPLPADRQIEWGNFLPTLAETPPIVNGAPAPDFNFGRSFDHLISKSLYNLPIPGAEPQGSNNLPFRNLARGLFYGLPSGQDVARAIGVDPIPASDLNVTGDPAFADQTPLWQYVNGEAERLEGGHRLGPVGAAIDGQTFLRVLASTPDSILQENGSSDIYRLAFTPDPSFTASCSPPGTFGFQDFVVFAGVADCPS
jgi:hypothetical protein